MSSDRDNNTETWENEDLRVVLQRRPHSGVVLRVHTGSALTARARAKTVKKVAKTASVPGFRKGKAPDDLVLKYYPEAVAQHWPRALFDIAFPQVQQLTGITPFAVRALNPSMPLTEVGFDVQTSVLAQEGDLEIVFEAAPVVPEIDTQALTLQHVTRPVVDEAKIEEAIRQARFFFGKWSPVTDRPAALGDYVLLNVEDLDSDPPKMVFQSTRFEVSDAGMANWMQNLVIGLSKQGSAEGISIPDDSATEEEKKHFPPKKVRVTICEIERVILPELDDSFAVQLGVQTVATLRQHIEQILQREADAYVKRSLRTQVEEQLLEKYSFALPASLIRYELRCRLHHLLQNREFVATWEAGDDTYRQQITAMLGTVSERALQMWYFCKQIMDKAGISPECSDVSPYPTSTLETLLAAPPVATSHPCFAQTMGVAEAYARVTLEKVEDYLIAHANITN